MEITSRALPMFWRFIMNQIISVVVPTMGTKKKLQLIELEGDCYCANSAGIKNFKVGSVVEATIKIVAGKIYATALTLASTSRVPVNKRGSHGTSKQSIYHDIDEYLLKVKHELYNKGHRAGTTHWDETLDNASKAYLALNPNAPVWRSKDAKKWYK